MTFSVKTLALIEEGYLPRPFLNMRKSVRVCLLACLVGLLLGRSL
jgi:fluoride ion exporter CrcB/FEX